MDRNLKISNPTEDTVVLSGRTLRQIVSLMDRLKGMLRVIDISVEGESCKAFYKKRTHFWANTPENTQWTMQRLVCDAVQIRKDGNPWGRTIWDMYIAHDEMPKGHQAVWGKPITSANLVDAVSRIQYVIVPNEDVTADLDNAEKVIASYEARLATIGEWVHFGLHMEVRCGCGRSARFKARELFAGIPGDRSTSEIVKRLRCKSCGSANVIETTPFNSRGKILGPLSLADNDFIRWRPDEIVRESDHHPIGREDGLYTNLGGNGEDSVYVGDGIYIDPNGKLHDY